MGKWGYNSYKWSYNSTYNWKGAHLVWHPSCHPTTEFSVDMDKLDKNRQSTWSKPLDS